MLLDTFRQNLRAAMRSSPMTADQICKRAGYNDRYVRRILAGHHNPTLLFVECMAITLDITVEQLLKPIEGNHQ